MGSLSKWILDPHTRNPTKRKWRHKLGADALRVKKRHLTQNATAGIDKLPTDLLITILSRLSFKEAVRTSVLSCRWRYLWMHTGTLEFDDNSIPSNLSQTKRQKKFKALVNHVLELHQDREVHSLIIRFTDLLIKPCRCRNIDRWIYFVANKKVKRFELDLPICDVRHHQYDFPYMHKLLEVNSGYWSLKSLRLINVGIPDHSVEHLIASCPYIEDFCIRNSPDLDNLQIVDPFLPNLKVMEISKCEYIQSMEISSTSLVSCTFESSNINLLPLKKVPNLSELTLGGMPCESFVYEPNKHSYYSVQLVKLVLNFELLVHDIAIVVPPDLPQLHSLKRLELNVESETRRSLLFFTSLIKASPHLFEFKIKMCYRKVSPDYLIKCSRDTRRGYSIIKILRWLKWPVILDIKVKTSSLSSCL